MQKPGPINPETILNSAWHVVPDDEIGGTCITLGGTPTNGAIRVGNFLSEETAQHVAELHNNQIERKPMTNHAAAERIAREFHQTYERLAPTHGYQTRPESAVPWAQVPEQNRNLMIAVAQNLLSRGIIAQGEPEGPITELCNEARREVAEEIAQAILDRASWPKCACGHYGSFHDSINGCLYAIPGPNPDTDKPTKCECRDFQEKPSRPDYSSRLAASIARRHAAPKDTQ